ncbi:MAG TPA: murein biosynthesis integral membrane protein MurJ [Gemmatimonadales bacterium]|nr:murein biosynthesis integral membrane protein MurJ [Gemmatimonadales bacterium]
MTDRTGGGGGRHAARVAAGILVTRVLGYVRERVFAHYFGNGAAADAFRAALRIPNALRNLLGEGTLSASFIPVYAGLNEKNKEASRALAGAILGLLLLASGILAVIGIAFAPTITALVAQGFDAPRRELTTVLVRILFPMSGLMVVSAWCLGVLNTHRRFFLPYAAPALWNIAGIAAMVVAATWLTRRGVPPNQQLYRLSLALAWGTVAGSVLQIAIQLPSCWRLLGGIPLRVSVAPEGVRDVIVAWLPLVVGAGVAQLSGLVDTFLGSYTGEGGLASLTYAQIVQQLPISLFGTAVAAVSLPELSRDAVGETPNAQLRARIAVAFRRIAFFVIPSAFAFAALGPQIIGALYQTGRFTADDTILVGGVLAAYGIGLLGTSTVRLFASGFYALRDTRTPVKIAVTSLIISALLSWFFMRRFGPAGIALGASIGQSFNTVLHLYDLDKRIGAILQRSDWRALGLVVAAGLIAALLGMGAAPLVAGWRPVPQGIVVLAIFGVAYGALTLAFRHPDAIRAWQSLTGSPAN